MKAVGVDVGRAAVKAVLVSSGWTGCRVLDAVEVPVAGREPALVVDEALQRLGGTAESACVGLDRGQGMYRTLTFPFSDPQKIAQAAPFAAEEVLPVALDKLRIGHLPPRPDGQGRFAVAIHAVPRDMLDARLAMVAPHSVAMAQLDAMGSVEALLNGPQNPARTGAAVLLVDVGRTKTCLEVVSGNAPLYSRSLRLGTERMAAATAAPLGAGPGEQEAAFLEAFGGDGAEAPEEATRALMEVFERLASEIRRTLLSAREESGCEPGRVVLAGGGARLRLLTTYLADHLRAPVELLGLPEVAARGLDAPERLAAAYGLALVAADRGRVPLDLGEAPRQPAWRDPWVAILLLVALLLAGVVQAGRLWLVARRTEARVAATQTRTRQLLEQLGRPVNAVLPDEIRRIRALLDAFGEVGRSPLEVLDALAEAGPLTGDLRFRVVTIDADSLRVEAQAEGIRAAQEFQEALVQHPGFRAVEMTMNQQARPPGRGGANHLVLQAKLREEEFR